MSTTNHTITATVNGVDKTSFLLKDSVFIRLQLNNKANTAELKFLNYEPPERAEVAIYVNGTIVFGGYLLRKSASLSGVKTQANAIWSCECKDWSEILETVTVNQAYVVMSDKSIINHLFTTYLASAGFDVSTDVAILDNDLDITFVDITLREALDQLAQRLGANWYIKPDKKLYWFNKAIPQNASFSISSSPNQTTSFGFLNNSLSYEIDSSTIVNQVKIVAGTKSTGTKKTDNFTGTGSQKTFKLSEIPDSVLYVSYHDGTYAYTNYGSYVGYAPDDKLVSQGGTFYSILDIANKTITVEGNTGLAPANSTTVTLVYYYKEIIEFTFNDAYSQSLFGVYPYVLLNKTFASEAEAEALANNLLAQNAYGKASLKFDTTKYGLLPGQLVTIDITELGITQATIVNALLLENGDKVLLENGDIFLQEAYSLGQSFLVQEVSLTPIVTATNQFMLVCSVSAGRFAPNLIDSLASLTALKSSPSKSSNTSLPVRLSNISSDMGEVTLGRAVFTDGGTAKFSWSSPGGASGVVVGLEDTTSTYGALYIYDSGTVRAKLGRLNDLAPIGTIQPSGWGLYTENGFFKGVVTASQLIGGTVTGSLVQGGTVSGGLITGGTVTGALISGGTVTGLSLIGGTVSTGTLPINSSNPGVYMDPTGLYGYGTVGLTFRLSSDPSIKPWFSSGTILNTVYEINTSAVLRTGTTNPRIQIDNSGIFAYDSGGAARFTVDVATGRMTASQGSFSGTVTASALNGNTITGGTISGNLISGGTITGAVFSGGTVSQGTISAATISGGTILAGLFSGGTVSGGTVTGSYVSAASGNVILDSDGVSINAPTSYTGNRAIKWKNSSTTYSSLSGFYGSGTATLDLTAGISSTNAGRIFLTAYNTNSNYSYFRMYPDSYEFWMNSTTQLVIFPGTIMPYANIIPQDSSLNLQLGDSTRGFRYLYLKDDNGSIRRVSINTSGVLTVT